MLSLSLPRTTLAEALIPGATLRGARALGRDAILVAAGTLLVALCALVTIHLPFTPVPITGQTFAVLLVAAALGWARGTGSLALYLALGASGAPVFAINAGPASYGYLGGFVLAAAIVGWLAERGWDRRVWSCVAAMLIGEVAIYAAGLLWLGRFVPWGSVFALGVVPFLPGDAIKLVAATLLLPAIWSLVGHSSRRPEEITR